MNYRTVFNDKEVLTSIVNDNNTVTSSNEKFIIDTISNTILRLSSLGVDVSYFWKNKLIDRFEPSDTQIDISDHPTDGVYKRKAFVQSLSIDYSSNGKQFVFNVVVRHFLNGIYDNSEHDDVFVTSHISNDKLENGTPAFDFFYGVIKSGAYTLPALQDMRITHMDQVENRFDTIY